MMATILTQGRFKRAEGGVPPSGLRQVKKLFKRIGPVGNPINMDGQVLGVVPIDDQPKETLRVCIIDKFIDQLTVDIEADLVSDRHHA
jgi:hypothetical protein